MCVQISTIHICHQNVLGSKKTHFSAYIASLWGENTILFDNCGNSKSFDYVFSWSYRLRDFAQLYKISLKQPHVID